MNYERLDWVLSELTKYTGLFYTMDICSQKWGESSAQSLSEYRLYAQRLVNDGLATHNRDNETHLMITVAGMEFQQAGGYAAYLKRTEEAERKAKELANLNEDVKRTALKQSKLAVTKSKISIGVSIFAVLIALASFLFSIFHTGK